MHILHVIPDLSPSTGGPVTAVSGMASAQAALGHKVTIATLDYGLNGAINIEGVEVKVFPCSYETWRWSRALAQALPESISNSDIVHVHTMWQYPTWAASVACKKLNKPYILRPCGMLDKWSISQKAWKKWIYLRLIAVPVIRNAAAIHFTTEQELANSITFGKEDESFIIPNGLSASAYQDLPDPRAFRQRFPELEGRRIVLFLSRLHYKKQPDVVIKAFYKVCEIDDRLALVLAGPAEPSYYAELQALVRKLNLTERVIFTGLLQGDAVREAFCAAELFVLPSLQENFGIAVAEAMAAKCPVIVSDQVNLSTEIITANAGIVCRSDIQSVATAMKQMIKDDSLRLQMGNNGRNLVLDKFTWPRVASDLITAYGHILS